MVVEVQVSDGVVRPISAQAWASIQRVEWLADGTGLIVCGDPPGGLATAMNTQIWHLAYPGGETRMITHDMNRYADVSLTSDSRTLVAVQVELQSNVWVVGFNQTTTNARQITSGKADGYCGVSWTPDGKIVYVSRKIKYGDLWMMDLDGGNQKQLLDNEPVERFPSVTSDGRYIVFDSGARSFDPGVVGNAIWRMDIDGGNTRRLADNGNTPHCSPDGKWVTYQQVRGAPGTGLSSLAKVSIDGGQPLQITDKLTGKPAFSPDGKLIACLSRGENFTLQDRYLSVRRRRAR